MAVTITDATIAFPSGKNSQARWGRHLGPFKDGNDNLYVVAEYSGSADQIDMFKSTDDGATWSRVDTAGHPTTFANGLACIRAVQDGTTIHVIAVEVWASAGMGADYSIEYHTFDTSDAGGTADTWQTTNEAVVTVTTATTSAWYDGGIAVRSDGDVIVSYVGYASIMGTDYRRALYARREGGTWTTGLDYVGSATEEHFVAGHMVMADNDECHIFYNDDLSGAYGLTIDSANNLSTAVLFTSHTGSANPGGRPVYWLNGTTPQIGVVDSGRARRMTEDANGDLAQEAGQGVALTNDSTSTFIATNSLTYMGGDLFAFGASFATGYDGDLWVVWSPEGDDAQWGGGEELDDGISLDVEEVFSEHYVRGGNDYAGIVYWAGVLRFHEFQAGAPQTVAVGAVTETETAQPVLTGLPVRNLVSTGRWGPWRSSSGDMYVLAYEPNRSISEEYWDDEITVWKSENNGGFWYKLSVTVNPSATGDYEDTSRKPGPFVYHNEEDDTLDIFWSWWEPPTPEDRYDLAHVEFDMATETFGSVDIIWSATSQSARYPVMTKRNNGDWLLTARVDGANPLYVGTPGNWTEVISDLFSEHVTNGDYVWFVNQNDYVHIFHNTGAGDSADEGGWHARLDLDNNIGPWTRYFGPPFRFDIPPVAAYFDNRLFVLHMDGFDGPLLVYHTDVAEDTSIVGWTSTTLEADGEVEGYHNGNTNPYWIQVIGGRLFTLWFNSTSEHLIYREWNPSTHAWNAEVDTGATWPFPHVAGRTTHYNLYIRDSTIYCGMFRHLELDTNTSPPDPNPWDTRYWEVSLGAPVGDQTVQVVPVKETETPQTVTPTQGLNIAVGVVTETETAQVVTPVGEITVPVGVVTESENAQPVGASVDGAFTGWGIPIGIP